MTTRSQVLALLAAVPLMLAGCGGSEQPDPAANGAPEENTVHAQACFNANEGSPTSCKTYDAWKLYTISYCQSQGATAAATNVSEPCGSDGYRYVTMTCC